MEYEGLYSVQIYNSITSILLVDNLYNNIKYTEDSDEGTIFIEDNFIEEIGINITICIHVRRYDYLVRGFIKGFTFSKDNYYKLIDLLMRINSLYVYPNFKIYYDEEQIPTNIMCCMRYDSGHRRIERDEFYDSIHAVINRFKKYYKAILAVSLNLKDPEDALEFFEE